MIEIIIYNIYGEENSCNKVKDIYSKINMTYLCRSLTYIMFYYLIKTYRSVITAIDNTQYTSLKAPQRFVNTDKCLSMINMNICSIHKKCYY